MPSGRFANDLSGQEFNDLRVIKRDGTYEYNHCKKALWLCECKCGNLTHVTTYALRSGGTKSCGCRKHKPSVNYNGYEELSGVYWGCIQASAKKRGHSFDLKIEDAYNLFLSQYDMCALSGLEIKLERNYRRKRESQTASLDRIDSTQGYTLDNVQWVHKDIQLMKNSLTEERFYELCRRVAECA